MPRIAHKVLIPVLLFVLFGALVGGCGAGPAGTPIPTDLPPTSVPPTEAQPTAAIIIQSDATAAAPSTSVESPQPTSLNPAGPYIYFRGEDRIWISNPDGTFLKLIAQNVDDRNDLSTALSPDGKALLVITKEGDEINLMEYSLPEGYATKIDHLLTYTEADAMKSAGDKTIAYHALQDYPTVAWQPGTGRYIAYAAVRDYVTTDLHVYDRVTGEITQLTFGNSHTIRPTWSPDGQYILHYGVNWTQPFGGALAQYNDFHGAFATRLADGETVAQPNTERVNFLGWLNDQEYITFNADLDVTDGCSAGVFKAVNPANRETRLLTDECFLGVVAYSPDMGTILVSNSSECSCSPGEGLFLLSPPAYQSKFILEGYYYEMSWEPENQGFWPYPGPVVSVDGAEIYNPPPARDAFEASISKLGYEAWKIYQDQEATVVVKVPGGDWETIMTEKADTLIWDPISGDTLLITSTDGRLYRATAPEFVLEQVGEFGKSVKESGWILP